MDVLTVLMLIMLVMAAMVMANVSTVVVMMMMMVMMMSMIHIDDCDYGYGVDDDGGDREGFLDKLMRCVWCGEGWLAIICLRGVLFNNLLVSGAGVCAPDIPR